MNAKQSSQRDVFSLLVVKKPHLQSGLSMLLTHAQIVVG